jgi:uncharacterized protein YjbI with pentapeptide repeats
MACLISKKGTVEKKDFRNCVLSNASFIGKKFNNCNFQFANLDNSDFSNVKVGKSKFDNSTGINSTFVNANLVGSKFVVANFSGSNFSGAKFTKVDLLGAKFLSSIFVGAVFTETQMHGVNFTDSNLQSVDLSEAKLVNSKFNNADLRDADLTNATLVAANFSGANLSNADLNYALAYDSYFSKANLSNSSSIEVNFKGAEFMKANLTGADLTMSDFTGANLTGANLTDAYLTEVNFTRANLTGANFTSADLTDANFTGADLTDANFTGADLENAILLGANLTGADFTGAINFSHVPSSTPQIPLLSKITPITPFQIKEQDIQTIENIFSDTIFDISQAMEIPASEIDSSEDNVIFYIDKQSTGILYPREQLIQAYNEHSSIYVACKESCISAVPISKVNDDNVYIRINLTTTMFVNILEMMHLLGSNHREWHIQLTGIKEQITASILNVFPLNTPNRNLFNQIIDIVSGDHCQNGTAQKISSLTPIRLMTSSNTGGCKRKNRKSVDLKSKIKRNGKTAKKYKK